MPASTHINKRTMTKTSEAYILVTIPNATLTSSTSGTLTGQLAIEYVTFDIPSTAAAVTQHVLLVLVLRTGNNNNVVPFEAPLDPARALTVSFVWPSRGAPRRRYLFHATRDDAEFIVELPDQSADEDVELFHRALVCYVAVLRVQSGQPQSAAAPPIRVVEEEMAAEPEEDLCGRFVLINEDDGQIVGTLDSSVRVSEDPSLAERGHEGDPVVVELPVGTDTLEELSGVEVHVRTIPPEERDWMLKGAVFVGNAISSTTTLLMSAMTTASNLYIAHSTPSTSTPSSTAASPRPNTPSSSSNTDPLPSRALLILQSPTTRKLLDRIHTVSGSAVKLSDKAAATVESLILRVVGSGTNTNADGGSRATPSLPPRIRGASPAPPDNKRTLPPPYSKWSTRPSPSSSRVQSPAPAPPTTGTRFALSAAFILASLSASSVRLVGAGGAAVTAAVTHKYGTTAGENAALAARTARNIVLVYVDVRGLGRWVIVKGAMRAWVKARVVKAREDESAAREK